MSLDTTTLTGTNIPSIAARNVETRIKTALDGLRVVVEAFFASQGITATFYDDGTGDVLDLSAEAMTFLAVIAANNWDRFEASYWSAEEDRLNTNVMTVFPEMADPVIVVTHS
jgi:hypothetical protein